SPVGLSAPAGPAVPFLCDQDAPPCGSITMGTTRTPPPGPDTDQMLAAASRGDVAARGQLLERHRQKLRRMVALRLDRRLAPRVDPADVVQESLLEAAARFDEYIRARPLPFYPWLRRIACDHLADAHRRHRRAGRRSVKREEPSGLPDESVVALA